MKKNQKKIQKIKYGTIFKKNKINKYTMKQTKENNKYSFWKPIKISPINPIKKGTSNLNLNPLFDYPRPNSLKEFLFNNLKNSHIKIKTKSNTKLYADINSKPVNFFNFSPPKSKKNFKSNTNFIPKSNLKSKNNFDFGIPNPRPISIVKSNFNIPKKQMNWFQAMSKYPKLNPFGDADKDRVINMLDCRPFNKFLQEPKQLTDAQIAWNKRQAEQIKRNKIAAKEQGILIDEKGIRYQKVSATTGLPKSPLDTLSEGKSILDTLPEEKISGKEKWIEGQMDVLSQRSRQGTLSKRQRENFVNKYKTEISKVREREKEKYRGTIWQGRPTRLSSREARREKQILKDINKITTLPSEEKKEKSTLLETRSRIQKVIPEEIIPSPLISSLSERKPKTVFGRIRREAEAEAIETEEKKRLMEEANKLILTSEELETHKEIIQFEKLPKKEKFKVKKGMEERLESKQLEIAPTIPMPKRLINRGDRPPRLGDTMQQGRTGTTQEQVFDIRDFQTYEPQTRQEQRFKAKQEADLRNELEIKRKLARDEVFGKEQILVGITARELGKAKVRETRLKQKTKEKTRLARIESERQIKEKAIELARERAARKIIEAVEMTKRVKSRIKKGLIEEKGLMTREAQRNIRAIEKTKQKAAYDVLRQKTLQDRELARMLRTARGRIREERWKTGEDELIEVEKIEEKAKEFEKNIKEREIRDEKEARIREKESREIEKAERRESKKESKGERREEKREKREKREVEKEEKVDDYGTEYESSAQKLIDEALS
jgi:hypothetical protein